MKTTFLNALLFCALLAPGLAQPASSSRQDAAPQPLYENSGPVISLEELRQVSIPNITIDSVEIDPVDGACRVTATVRHPPANDQVKAFIALPMKAGTGGFAGMEAGDSRAEIQTACAGRSCRATPPAQRTPATKAAADASRWRRMAGSTGRRFATTRTWESMP